MTSTTHSDTGMNFADRLRTARCAALIVAVIIGLVSAASIAAPTTFLGTLSGAAESPPNTSPGTGPVVVTYDAPTHVLTVNVTFSGLQGTTTASHIHCCTAAPGTGTAGIATQTPTFVGFPLGVQAGTYSNSFDLTQAAAYNPAFITANGGDTTTAEATLVAGMLAGKAYLNVHSTVVPGGEIRSFLNAQLVFPVARLIPTLNPWMMALLAALVLAAGAAYARRRRR